MKNLCLEELLFYLILDKKNATETVMFYCANLQYCSARDWDGKDYLRIIPRVVLVEDPRLT